MKWLELHIDTARAGLEPVSELLREQGVFQANKARPITLADVAD